MPNPLAAGVVALVDDDAFVLRALERALIAHGYRVRAFSSAEQFLARSNASEISCAVIDIELNGGRSGLDLGQDISVSAYATPVVFMTASNDPALRRRAMEIGCVDFLEKPFLTSCLIAAIIRAQGRDS
ncbi:MAG: response regulator transcription factor [Usitatibacter sp.]